MNCEDIALVLDDVDLGTLDHDVRHAVEEHLAGCPACDRVWSPLAHLAKSRTPALPTGFSDRCAALVVADSLPSGKRAHTRFIVLGCLVAGVAAAGIMTMHLSIREVAVPHRSVTVAAPVTISELVSASSVTVDRTAVPGEVVSTTTSEVSLDPRPVGSEPSKSSPDACADLPERVAALPGVTGFDLPKQLFASQAAAALASEIRDPVWAADMERQISEALRKKEGLHLSREEIVCRMTACGILLAYRADADSAEVQAQKALASELRFALRDSLGFLGGGISSMDNLRCGGARFTLISLTRANGRAQHGPPEVPPIMPAFPGTPGSGVQVANPLSTISSGNIRGMLAELLAEEPVDRSAWSLEMESALKGEASAVAGDHWNEILVECRVTTCGVVLGGPRSAGATESRDIATRLVPILGRASGSSITTRTITSGDFVVIYLRDDKR